MGLNLGLVVAQVLDLEMSVAGAIGMDLGMGLDLGMALGLGPAGTMALDGALGLWLVQAIAGAGAMAGALAGVMARYYE